MKHLLIILSILLLSSPVIGQSKETCYVVVDSSKEFNPTLLSYISVSVISQYLREVEPIPQEGVSQDSCLYHISVSKEKDTTFVTFKGKNLNSYGDSKLSGTDGFQQSLLKSLYRSLRDKRKLICEDYGELIKKCGSVVNQDTSTNVESKIVKTDVEQPSVYRLVIVTEPNKLHRSWKPVGHPDEFYRVVCGLPDAIDWAQKTIFKGRTWHPVKATSVADRDAYTHPHGPCDAKIVGSSHGGNTVTSTVSLA